MTVRVATDDDWPAILEVHRLAFGENDEDEGERVAHLADELRADPALYVPELSFVSLSDDPLSGNVVAGHVMNTWNFVGETPVLQFSPLGVLPEHQRQGHGSALVRASLDAVRALGEPALLLEGSPKYYGRFGFVRADELGLLPPPEALYDWGVQVAVFDEARLPRGQIQYSAPFRH
jgi:putative acetyltransferase